jgi:hypothetical protein
MAHNLSMWAGYLVAGRSHGTTLRLKSETAL